ncbi:hypothetical protein PV325_002811 [Microctonus aethiopoides]|nr:hypothetical protein PV325_002811 [Microctonus aethiopoides]KAK0096593.1 hypothetical protein PV326_005027 [Microctonus aethiopoides]
MSNQQINRISTLPKDKIDIEKDKKFIAALDNVKSKVMINHTKCLRELHASSERCYIKRNASKCIQIASYCPHLINVKDKKSGMTPFHKVCYHGHVCLVTFMLEKGANPWLTTDAGETALCLAIQACIKNPNGSIVCLESLQSHGCYLDCTNKWYRIYLESALLTNNKLLARWMFDQASPLGKRCASFPLTLIGAISAILYGICTPGIIILYGNLADLFLQYQIPKLIDLSNNTTTIPIGFRPSLSNVTADELTKQTVYFSITSASLSLAQLIFTTMYVGCLNIAALNQSSRARKIHFKALLQQNIAWLTQQDPEELAEMSIKDINSLQNGLGHKLGNFIATSCGAACCVIVSMYHGYRLAGSLIAIVPVIAVLIYATKRIIHRVKKHETNHYRAAQILVRDCLQHLRLVMAYSKEEYEVKRYADKLIKVEHCDIIRGSIISITGGTLCIMIYSMYGFAFWYGVELLKVDDNYSVASLIIVTFCTHIAIYQIFQIPPYVHIFKKATNAATQMVKDTPNAGGKQPDKELTQILTFEKVTFGYSSSSEEILKNVSFAIDRGTTTALIGPRGVGKTSCLSLIHKFFPIQNGKINFNGINIQDIDTSWLRFHIGYSQQCPVLFGTTPNESITCCSPIGNLEHVKSVIEIVGMNSLSIKFDRNLSLIWDLPVDERQRIALARILYRSPDILMMDNSLSALSSKNEEEIFDRIQMAYPDLTIIIVTSNFRILNKVQKILYLDQGIIEEFFHVEEMIQIHPETKKLMIEKNGTIDNFEIETIAKCRKKPSACGTIFPPITSFFEKSYQELFRSGLIQIGNHSVIHQFPDISTSSSMTKKVDLIKMIKFLLRDRKHWLHLLLICVSSIVLGLNLPMYTVLFGETLNLIAMRNTTELQSRFNYFATMFLVAGFVAGFCKIIQDSMLSIVESKLATRIRRDTLTLILQKKMEWFDTETKTICEMLSILRKSPDHHREFGKQFVFLLETLSSLTVSIFLSVFYNWKLGLATHMFTPLILLFLYYNRILVEQRAHYCFSTLNKLKKTITESIRHAEVIAALTLEHTLINCYNKDIETVITNHRGIKIQAFIHGCCVALPQMAYAVVILYGGYMLTNNEIDAGTVFKVAEAIILGTLLIGHLVLPMASNIHEPEESQNIVNILEYNVNESKAPNLIIDKNFGGKIIFKDVSFVHSHYAAIPKLFKLNFEINAGERIAFVGRPYSGVSIPIQLLLGFYDYTSGEIFLDGKRLHDYDMKTLRNQMGIIESEPRIFKDTIAYNISYGVGNKIPASKVIAISKRAYYTVLDEEEIKLTVSQKIQLSLARALVRNPRILLFENMKYCETEQAQRRLEKIISLVSKERTCVASTQDPSSVIRVFPRLIFVNRGKIMESGSHAELLASNGHYSDMWRDIETNLQ